MSDIEKKLLNSQREKTLKHNDVANIAWKEKREYITPEDVTEAFKTISEDKVRLDVLEILGSGTGFGIEDESCTAFVAFNGKEK